ncbi:MAG: hypothetical protein ACR2NB_08870 [Solirubrobacteraceae bacterium]
MVVQASAGQRLAARDPQLTAAAFAAISGAAHEAEDDMRRLVALLGDERETGPAPDLALVDELVARAVGSGLDVTLRSTTSSRAGFRLLAERTNREVLANEAAQRALEADG